MIGNMGSRCGRANPRRTLIEIGRFVNHDVRQYENRRAERSRQILAEGASVLRSAANVRRPPPGY
jgi:hypothetical protein